MTFLFTDIAGSTRLWEESAEMHQRVERHFEVLREAVEDVGGEVFATMGDGIAAAFSSAEAAVRTAIVAQCQLRAMGLSVRMGVHSGEAEHVDGDFRGRPLNRAARIMAAGHGGQILVSDLTAELVRSGPHPMEMSDLGTHRLRDLIHPERLWQVEHPHLDRDFPPVRGLDTYSNNLPTQRSSLIGRERDTARVTDLMGHHRLVTLTGVGGVGKTRLAVQAAADMLSRFASVWFVELASVADPDDVADAIAVSLEVSAVTDPLGAAAAMLSGADALLVIDNCEHVVDSVAEAIDALTLKCPGLSVIATSREPLGVDGEHVMTVRPLHPSSTAIDLFNQRSLSAGGDPTAMDVATIEQICRRLDGIPLAIELAASRAATLGPTAILAGLDNRLSLLGRRRRRTVDRHATMRETIDWSYRLLDAGEQRLFRSLAMFSNGFELDAAISIAGSSGVDEYTATTRIDSLVQKSMIVPEVQPRAVRYRMLQTMRAFALERVDEHGERLEATTAMAEWVATITDLPFADCCSAMVERNAIRLEREAENWRDAVMLAARLPSGALAARLCGPPVAFFLLGRHDLGDFVRPLLDVCGDKPQQRRAVLCALIVSAAGATDPAQLQVWADEIAGIDAIEPTGLGGLMQWLALAWRGDFAASVELCAAASLDPRISQSTRDMFVGIATLDHFSLTNATEDRYGLIERALEVATRSDVALHRVSCLLGAAWGLSTHRPDQSLVLVRRALADIPNVPALTRLTLPGSASRLLAQLDPGIAARGLLEQLDSTAQRRSFVDLIPLFYATALLHRVGHPSAGPAMETMSVSPIAPYLSMMDFVDLARRASTANNAVSLTELETIVRIALGDLCGTADAKFHQGTTSVSSSSSAER